VSGVQFEALFGVSRSLSSQDAKALESYLVAAWIAQTRKLPAGLDSDLALLAGFFAPTSTSRRLRAGIAGLQKLSAQRPALLTDEIFLESPSGRGLVTPEGRVLLHLLAKHGSREAVLFNLEEIAWAYRAVADLYRAWGRFRLIEALGIKESALRLSVVGFNLALLVNGSIGEERAFPVPAEESEEQELSGIIGPIIDAFVEVLRPRRKRRESFRLRGGWVLTETSRHLSAFVSFTSGAIWIRQNRQRPLVDRLGNELARDKGRALSDIAHAFDALLLAYGRARPALSARAVGHERSAQTRIIKERLLVAFGQASANWADR
jgi:hypothetical protein